MDTVAAAVVVVMLLLMRLGDKLQQLNDDRGRKSNVLSAHGSRSYSVIVANVLTAVLCASNTPNKR